MNVDLDFADRCREAVGRAEGSLATKLMRRRLEGEQVPVYLKGEVVGHNTRKSDSLLMSAIKNLRHRRESDMPKATLGPLLGLQGTDRLPPAHLRHAQPTLEAWTAPVAEILDRTEAAQDGARPSDRT